MTGNTQKLSIRLLEVAARGLEALKVRLLHNSGLLRLLATELGGVI
jgi:hypothetical protein